MSVASTAVAQSENAQIAQEYFVQQAADEALLIRINAFEAEFESELSAQDGEVILRSGIPGSRIAPVFQYVNAPEKTRQLNIKITSNLNTRRSKFGIELVRMSVWDNRSESVSRAYQLLSFGMQVSKDQSKANWTVKIDSIANASRLFQRFGMKEMRLWADYLVAHMIEFHLHDHSIVYSMTREILADSKGTHLKKIELAALQLQSSALIGLKRSGSLSSSANNPDPVQSALSQVAVLAQSMGFHFELASALNVSGSEYAAGSLYTKALEQFQLAVQIADAVGDMELATGIRERIVEIHAVQGNAPASGKILKQIETQLVEGGGGDELALNLLAQGRLFIRSYRFDLAIDVLYQALNYENNSAIRKQINLELARVFYETGRLDESLAYLQLAAVNPDSIQQRRTNSILDLDSGLRIMANIRRTRGEFEQMRKARSAQAQYQPEDARYLYDRGLDELASPAKNRQQAQLLFRQSHETAGKSGDIDLQHLSRLQLCALGSTGISVQALCSKTNTRGSYEWLLAGGVPRFSNEAMFLWAQILVSNGRRTEAIAVLDHLIDEIHLFRYSLPGVLGAWYRERHEQLFEYYLELLVAASSQRGGMDDLASLLALSKIRHIGKYTGFDSVLNANSGDTELLRTQLSQRTSSAPGQLQSDLSAKITRGLARIRTSFRKKFEYLSKSGLREYLQNLKHDEIMLTYHISPTTAQVWVGKKGNVKRRSIANPAYIYAALKESRQGLADIGTTSFNSKMDALGKRLVAPVADLLSKTIYWIPAGPLLGFPLDAIRINGRYLLERHSIVNLLSFPLKPNPAAGLQTGSLQNVFLAGHPQAYSSNYAMRLDTSAEIRAIADIFIGPGLHIVQGVALLADEFQGEHFQKANLVHLSMPGSINLKYPDQSSLELSGSENDPARTSFTPQDIHSQKLGADLVFLSATRMTQDPLSGFNNRPGLVADFLDAGANAVIASLWATDGKAAEVFIADFYRKLEASKDVADSLEGAKRQYLKNNRDNGLYDWAGYQLFIR